MLWHHCAIIPRSIDLRHGKKCDLSRFCVQRNFSLEFWVKCQTKYTSLGSHFGLDNRLTAFQVDRGMCISYICPKDLLSLPVAFS